MLRFSFMLTTVCFLVGCNNKESGQHKLVEKSKYPHIIDSLQLQSLYDEVKWNLYLLECDDTPKNNRKEPIVIPAKSFASLELKFDSLLVSKDTLRFYFDFYDGKQIISRIVHKNLATEYFNGMMFYDGLDSFSKCWLLNYSNFSEICVWAKNRHDYDLIEDRAIRPLQKDVIEYINKNKATIHPWFYSEAKKRGVIKE